MPTFTMTKSYQDGQILTEAMLDDIKTSTETFLNTTKIDSDNIQDSGITKAKLIAAVQNALCPPGSLMDYAGTTAPVGWLLRDGSEVSRTTYADLYAITGDKFGEGDGSTTFNLPDDRGLYRRIVAPDDATCSGNAGDPGTDLVTATGHSLNRTGMKVRVTGTPVTGLSLNTTYYLIVDDVDAVGFATNRTNALAGTKISISGSAASMTIVCWESPDSGSGVAPAPGGSTGNSVGSMLENATAVANTALAVSSSGNHTHTTGTESASHTHLPPGGSFGWGVSSGVPFAGGGASGGVNTTQPSATESANHTHSISSSGAHTHNVDSGGDNETRSNTVVYQGIIKT